MSTRFVLLAALATAAGSPLPPGMVEHQGQRYFSVDLSDEKSNPDTDALYTTLRAERRKASISPKRRAEISLAQGLLRLRKGDYVRAIEFLSQVSGDNDLKDAAFAYRARARRLQAERSLSEGTASNAVGLCKLAQEDVKHLAELLPGPFSSLAAEEDRLSRICQVRALLATHRYAEAKERLVPLLMNGMEIPPAERELFVTSLAQILKDEGESVESRHLAQQGLTLYPQNMDLKRLAGSGKEENPPDAAKAEPSRLPTPQARSRPEEKEVQDAQKLLRQGKHADAFRKLTGLLERYPGSIAAAKSSPSLQIAAIELGRKGQWDFLHDARRLPPEVLYSLAKSLWEENFDSQAGELFAHYVRTYPTATQAGHAIFSLGRIAENQKNWSQAREWYEKLVDGYSANPFFERAHFKIGWLSFVLKEYERAITWLDYDRALARDLREKPDTAYWLARAYEASGKKADAERFRKEVGRLAPLSYYALLAGESPALLPHPPGPPETSADFWNALRIRRARSYLAGGLPSAAAFLLREVDLESDPSSREEVAQLFAVAGQHRPAVAIASQNVSDRWLGVGIPAYLAELIFPIGFEGTVKAEAQAVGLNPLLLFSLIKQESVYQEDAKSPVGALGLMQLMPETARKIAEELQEPPPKPQELLASHRNVKLGARYLARQLDHFGGNLVYALAAYNAGPIKVDLWVKYWGDLAPEEFVELIPYEETRNYVRAIMRNYAYYLLLVEKRTASFAEITQVKKAN